MLFPARLCRYFFFCFMYSSSLGFFLLNLLSHVTAHSRALSDDSCGRAAAILSIAWSDDSDCQHPPHPSADSFLRSAVLVSAILQDVGIIPRARCRTIVFPSLAPLRAWPVALARKERLFPLPPPWGLRNGNRLAVTQLMVVTRQDSEVFGVNVGVDKSRPWNLKSAAFAPEVLKTVTSRTTFQM